MLEAIEILIEKKLIIVIRNELLVSSNCRLSSLLCSYCLSDRCPRWPSRTVVLTAGSRFLWIDEEVCG
jgi:hypothetical protein